MDIHNNGKDIELDPMYNKGMFYKALVNRPKYRFDLNALEKGYDAESGDARKLPIESSSINCMILDPPFMFGTHGQTKNSVISKRYTMFDTFEELRDCYIGILKEAYRVLKKYGILIFKCQDYTDSKTTMTHCMVYRWATKIGVYAKDIAILNLPKDKIYNGNLVQRHLRKTHCYFYVLQKKNSKHGGNKMPSKVDKIINTTVLTELLDEINDFCRESCMRDDDTECMELKERIENKSDSDIHMILASYLSVCEDGDEVIESLYEFVSNCKGFVQADEDTTQQVTKGEFETILNECEGKCGIQSGIEKEYVLKMAEVPMVQQYREFTMKFKGNDILLFLPRIDIDMDTKQYIAGELGAILYDVLKSKISHETLLREINRYIPETRNSKESARQLFRKYFYSVVQYKERKPGIYPEFDEHMKQALDMEYFRRMIAEYLLE